MFLFGLSLPSRERGLKSHQRIEYVSVWLVAPFAGAWIEICRSDAWSVAILSLPSRERGLKYLQKAGHLHSVWSLPSRERGLKSVYV